MAYKFIRAIEYSPTSGQAALASTYKMLYEAWCYCLNGGASPTTPGGLPATTPSTFPTNFLEGTSVLATGTDGVTTVSSSQIFTSASASFATTVIGKHLVAWKPGSGSTDDSIYMIRARPSPTTLVIESRNGGTPDPVTQKPTLTSRSGIIYRVIDLPSVLNLLADNQYIVFQLNGSSVNVGQANSQVQLFRRSTFGAGIVVSPGGTWTGSAFTDGSTEASGGGFGGGSQGVGYITMILDPAMMLLHLAGGGFGSISMHVEVPVRLYSQVQDPNPVTWQIPVGGSGTLFDTNNGYGNSMRMQDSLNVTRLQRLITRSLAGDGTDAVHRTIPGNTMTGSGSSLNTGNGKVMSSEAMLGTMATTQYTFARVRMRGTRLAGAYYPSFMRFGDLGEWIHIQNGVYWPWDNAILPFNLFAGGI